MQFISVREYSKNKNLRIYHYDTNILMSLSVQTNILLLKKCIFNLVFLLLIHFIRTKCREFETETLEKNILKFILHQKPRVHNRKYLLIMHAYKNIYFIISIFKKRVDRRTSEELRIFTSLSPSYIV